jgi:hypothetical protein
MPAGFCQGDRILRVEILGARTSGPHVFTFHHGHSAVAAPVPALSVVSPLRLISKRLCAKDMRTGGPRTQGAHPARAPSSHTLEASLRRWHFASGNPGCADLRSACLHLPSRPLSSSSTRPNSDSSLYAPSYLKAALCKRHADRRSAHPGRPTLKIRSPRVKRDFAKALSMPANSRGLPKANLNKKRRQRLINDAARETHIFRKRLLPSV